MNWNTDLRRISVILWSVLASFLVGVMVMDIYNGHPLLQWLGLIAATVAVFYGLHRLTCWVIDGFSPKR